jgi:hypothetical protein
LQAPVTARTGGRVPLLYFDGCPHRRVAGSPTVEQLVSVLCAADG